MPVNQLFSAPLHAFLPYLHHILVFHSCILRNRKHWMTILKFWPKSILKLFFRYQISRNRNQDFVLETNYSETDTFFRDQIRWNRNWYFFPRPDFRNQNRDFFLRPNSPPKIDKGLETEAETETSQYPWQFLEKSSPNISLLFLLCFPSPPEKKIFSLSKYFPPFFPPFSFSFGIERQRQRRVVFAFLHLRDGNKTKNIRLQIRDVHCLLGIVSFSLFWFFLSQTKFSETETFFRTKFLKPKLRLFFQTKFHRNPQKLAKVSKLRSFETEMSISVRKEMIALQEEEEARRSWKKNNVGKM